MRKTKGKHGKAKGLAGKVKRLEKHVRNLVEPEQKYTEVQVNSAAAPAIGVGSTAFATMNMIAEGDNQSQRSGVRVKVLRMHANVAFQWNSSGNDSQACRVVVVRQRTNEGAATLSNAFLDESSAPTIGGTADYTSALYNPLYKKADGYSVLYDKRVVLTVYRPNIELKIRLNKKFITYFNGSAASVADIEGNIVQVWVYTDSSAANPPNAYMTGHCWYIDN